MHRSRAAPRAGDEGEQFARTAPPFRADHVGSLLRPAAPRDARAPRGEIEAAALTQIEDAEITRLVARQEAIGLKSITDGEFRRASWQTDFLQALDGIETFLGDPKLEATGRCQKPRQDEPANGYSSLWGAVASSGLMSGSGNWLGAGIGLSSSSPSAFDSGRTGVGITGKGCGIVPSGSGVGLGSGESKGPGARERASDGGDGSICTGSSAWTIAEPNVSDQKAVTRSRSWKPGRLTEAKVCKPPSHARILFAAIRKVDAEDRCRL